MIIETNYCQRQLLTPEQLREEYEKLSKDQLIEMLIANNAMIGIVETQQICHLHNFYPLPSTTIGINRWQCSKCGVIMEGNEYFSTTYNSYKPV